MSDIPPVVSRTVTVAVGLTLLLVSATVAPVAATVAPVVATDATQIGEQPSFVVDLAEDGSAEISLTLTFDLSTDAERAAFSELQDNETAQERATKRFSNRMAAVAAGAENATGREMAVENARIELSTTNDGEIGVIVLRVTYSGLAAVDGDTLVVTEPFASGFEPDRSFVLRGPDGYAVSEVSPNPAASDDGVVRYEAGTSLDGFRVTFAPSDGGTSADGDADGTSGSGPGFGAVAALLALALVASRVPRHR